MTAAIIPVCLKTPSSMLLKPNPPLKSRKGGVKQGMPVNIQHVVKTTLDI